MYHFNEKPAPLKSLGTTEKEYRRAVLTMDTPNTSLAHVGPSDWIWKLSMRVLLPLKTTQKLQLENTVAHFPWIRSQEEPITHLLWSLA